MSDNFFILTAARSGSTSLARILDTMPNCHCACEPAPNLDIEARKSTDGNFDEGEKEKTIQDVLVPRVKSAWESDEVYGEKNITYGPFIQQIRQQLNSKFVFLHRDGREVVRSLMNWHNQMFGDIYRECKDTGDLSQRAVNAAASLPAYRDGSDFSRPRPVPGDPFFGTWENMSREQMCGWYWNFTLNLYKNELEKGDKRDWFSLDYSDIDAEKILKLMEFLNIKGGDVNLIQEMLDSRINSVKERCGEENGYPHWTNWDGGGRRGFEETCSEMMCELNYFGDQANNWKPKDYGKFWLEHDGGIEWYEWMYQSRAAVHNDLISWVGFVDPDIESIQSIVDIGCGMGVGYCDAFKDRNYTGIDLDSKSIQWCLENRSNSKHHYIACDFITNPPDGKYDLVCSSGTIDNTYDIESYLQAMIGLSKKWVYLTCYRGWFPNLDEHQYTYNEEQGCFYNDVSPGRIREALLKAGCMDIIIEPVKTGRSDIPYETKILARVS